MNRLFDPDMFDFMLESVDHDRYVIATYYIEDTLLDHDWIEHLQQVQRMALEGSTSSWQRVKEDTGEVRGKLTSKVLGYYEVPTDNLHKKAAIIQLGFPIDAWDTNLSVPMMLLTVSGNAFVFGDHVKLLDVYFPKEVAERFKGPKFGIEGLREKKGIPDRPMVLHIIKPKMGMTPEQTANQVFQTAMGGADFAKDDEMLSELGNSTWEKRLEAVLKAVDKAEKETGKRLTYMLSITDSYENLIPKAKRAVKLGAEGILVAYSAGPAALRALAEDPEIDVPILLHISHMLAGLHHINFPTYSN
jgi:2,3-diketo-5-methylthiopentyl-1-phosphate enolase